ncbi:MAG: Rha family transcriptional regulator [Roseburia sp.]
MTRQVEYTLDSREVAEMIGKEHSKLLRDINRYVEQLNESKIGLVDFFQRSTYIDAKGESRPCYKVTRKGCEFIANKLTGIKGTEFTAQYINRFHEMENMLLTPKKEKPWYINPFRGKDIVLYRDFEVLTGINPSIYSSYRRPINRRTIAGKDYNGWGRTGDCEQFKREYGFDCGTDPCMMYLLMNGFWKIIAFIKEENPKASYIATIELPKVFQTVKFVASKEIPTNHPSIEVNISINGVPIDI